ncbi:preprotein translocase subunit SecA [Helicobacter anatolicus]|uniref:preprotein translocase subunit SecA n=1 Tax=Helicobacter anatolicus TaxID=2905874 RepID=UPI001E3B12CE|nr:preprotein translocase subunit SecA [Helicobacter anatolicus]MCE3040405.1 preprotein translocase subunit SecA [Helicobacter anatolicus]
MVQSMLGKIFGTRNTRLIKKYKKRVQEINQLESKYQELDDEALKQSFLELQKSVREGQKNLDDVLSDSFAITREASKRVLGMRHFDVQLIGGMVLHEGRIAEMKTGEGKTLVATLPVILNALSGKGIHVVTVNDYLANRDAKIMEPLYNFLGFEVGVITGDEKDDSKRLEIYAKDIVYGTNNEFGFDYLRDNMKYDLAQKVQKSHYFAIVDEVDSILIDEARTPLIISGPVNRQMENYKKADIVAKKMQDKEDFSIDEKSRVILLTDEGIKKAEELFGVDNLYSLENAALSHHLDQALKANYLFFKDKDYVVADGEVVIVDEFTGRLSEGRRFSEGLHQALEAKENVPVKEESQTLADITFQNYFRLYEKLAGMTGTAQTEATEFLQIYNLEVVSIPTNLPVQRKDLNDLIYKSEREKFDAVIAKIQELHAKGQPVLVGTASIEKSELLHALLQKQRIPHTVLNAKQHTREAEIIKDAGVKGAVTIATNMAGRGVDIKLSDEIKALGGLYIIGTERHESRRIDNQLRGRSGRQGDPGTSQFYLSLEDSLLRIFGSDKIKGIMEKLGLKDGEHIESSLVTRSVENAQKKVESLHFESRKHLLEYDDVANEQRKTVYKFRNELLDPNYDIQQRINENRIQVLEEIFARTQIIAGDMMNFDLQSLVQNMQEGFNLNLKQEDLQNKEYDELFNFVLEKLKQEYEQKMSILALEQRSEIERVIYLQVLDNSWREHLYTMDNLKTGIGLRGYNQKDPLVEYKKESYNLFLELINAIKHEAIKTLQIVQFQQEQVQHQTRDILHELEKSEKFENNRELGAPRIARNDPCPCGSGKKYKQCHGKSGPKKGLLAKT